MPRKYLIVLFFLAFAPPLAGQGLVFADSYTQDGKPCPPECVSDSMEIVTWYPSPYNEYEELRLYPTQRDNNYCDNDKIGLMYYDDGGTPSFGDDDKMRVCKGTLLGWQEVGLAYWGASGNNIYNTNSGRVGIGTTNPSGLLEISHANSAATDYILRLTNPSATGYGSGIEFYAAYATPSVKARIASEPAGAAQGGYLRFDTQDTSGNSQYRMIINQYGNVGIGTTAPKSEIQIGPEGPGDGGPPIGSLNMFANRGGRTYGHNIYFNLADLTYRRVTGSYYPTWIEMDSDNRGDIIFHTLGPGAADSIITSAELSGAPKMTIKNNGNIGIGTTSPMGSLHIVGHASQWWSSWNYGPDLIIDGPRNNAIAFLDGQSANPWAVANAGGGLIFNEMPALDDTNTGALVRLFIQRGSGNVGIGTANPGYKLTVNGSTYCATGAWSGSDLRWKKNILTLTDPLEKISRLRGVEFDWKREEYKDKNFPEGRQIGIIAQELEKEFPELVSTDNAGYKSIAYDKLTAVLVEAVKEQQAQMRNQQRKIEILELKLKELDEKR